MSLESLHAAGIDAAIQRQIDNPQPAPGASFRFGSFLSSGVRGIPAGLEEGIASATDFLSGSGAARAYASLDNSEQGNAASKAQRESAPTDISVGNEIRAKVSEWKPDPVTQHTADQVLFGLTRVAGKATAAIALGGPVAGGAGLAAEETNTQYRDLVERGIDPATALKVAGVQGAVTGATVGIPMVGSTVGRTVALGLGTGPLAYMGQEKLSREILERAGYHDEASLHDPTDPLGLTLSTLLPAIFGGVHIAGLRGDRAKPIGPIARESEVKGAVALTPAEQQISDAFERSAGNLKELRDAVAAEKNPANKALLEAELSKQTEAAANAVGKHVLDRAAAEREVVDAARVRTTSDAMNLSMPHDLESPELLARASDDISAGRMPDVPDFPVIDATPAVREPLPLPPGVEIREVAGGFEAYKDGQKVGYLKDNLERGQAQQIQENANIDIVKVDKEVKGQGVGTALYDAFYAKHEGMVAPSGKTTADAWKVWQRNFPEKVDDFVHQEAARIRDGADPALVIGNITDARVAERVASEARAPAREASQAPAARPAQPVAGRQYGENSLPPADQVGIEPVAAAKPSSEGTKAPEVQRAEELAAQTPDAKTVLPGSDKPVTVQEALELAKEEHKFELSESNLVKAALECALGFGA